MALARFPRLSVVAALGAGVLAGPLAADAAPASALVADPVAARPVAARPAAGPTQAARAGTRPRVTKVLTFVVENHSLGADAGRDAVHVRGWPASTATPPTTPRSRTPRCRTTSPSPAARTFGVADDNDPSAPPDHAARRCSGRRSPAGRPPRSYAEGMPSQLPLTHAGDAVRRQAQPVGLLRRRAHAAAAGTTYRLDRLAPRRRPPGTLPNVGMVDPRPLQRRPRLLARDRRRLAQDEVAPVLAGPDWRSGRLAVVITADEDDRSGATRCSRSCFTPASTSGWSTPR